MRAIRVLCFVAAMCVSALAFGQEPAKQAPKMGSKEWTELEKTLWDVDQQWLCSAGATPYHKDYKECVEFRNQFWTDQFFEISIKGKVQTKAEMVAAQRAAHPSKGVGPQSLPWRPRARTQAHSMNLQAAGPRDRDTVGTRTLSP